MLNGEDRCKRYCRGALGTVRVDPDKSSPIRWVLLRWLSKPVSGEKAGAAKMVARGTRLGSWQSQS